MKRRRELLPTIADDDDDGEGVEVGEEDEGGEEETEDLMFALSDDEESEAEAEEEDEGETEEEQVTSKQLIERKIADHKKEMREKTKKVSLKSVIPQKTKPPPKSQQDEVKEDGDQEEEEEERKEVKEEEEKEDEVTAAEKSDFFSAAPELAQEGTVTFEEMKLSSGMLRSIKAMGYERPTAIQANAVSLALEGKDVCASSVTGTGKTAAFLIPVIERLAKGAVATRRSRKVGGGRGVRCVVLTPTRELAEQCSEVFEKLAKHTKLTHAVIIGGTPSHEQLAALQGGSDVIIATPGRLADHVLNSPSVDLSELEVLVLDEADQLLDLGFTAQVEAVSRASPKQRRQTLLFSATMTDEVDKLAKLALNRPVWLAVDRKYDMNETLTHELVRVEDYFPTNELNPSSAQEERISREAVLLSLCRTEIKERALVFCASRKEAHGVCLTLAMAGLSAAELHGDLGQVQRSRALDKFKKGVVDYLVSTDLASRGLDVEGVQAVINFTMPKLLVRYVHRVGRTARAGKGGRAVSLICQKDESLVKQVLAHTKGKAVRRKLSKQEVVECRKEVQGLSGDVTEVMQIEKQEQEVESAEREATRATNLLLHDDEIQGRPKKKWVVSASEKKRVDAQERRDSRGEPRKKRPKKEIKEFKARNAELRSAKVSAKSAKRAFRRGEFNPREDIKRESLEKKAARREKKRRSPKSSSSEGPSGGAPAAFIPLRKGGKQGHNSFKSKKRFKRK